jgi:hypothetical protein
MALVEQRLKGLHCRVQSEKSIQVDQLVLRDRDRRPKLVVAALGMGHHDIEAIGRTPLEDHYELFTLGLGAGRLGEDGAPKECRHH